MSPYFTVGPLGARALGAWGTAQGIARSLRDYRDRQAGCPPAVDEPPSEPLPVDEPPQARPQLWQRVGRVESGPTGMAHLFARREGGLPEFRPDLQPTLWPLSAAPSEKRSEGQRLASRAKGGSAEKNETQAGLARIYRLAGRTWRARAFFARHDTAGAHILQRHFDTWSVFIPERLVAQMVTSPAFLAALPDLELIDASADLTMLCNIAYSPKALAWLLTFMERLAQGEGFLPPQQYFEVFNDLAMAEIDEAAIPVYTGEAWAALLPPEATAEQRGQFCAVMDEIVAGAQPRQDLPVEEGEGGYEEILFQKKGKGAVEKNLGLVLSRYRAFNRPGRVITPAYQGMVASFVRDLATLPLRDNPIDRLFRCTEVALNVLGRAQISPTDMPPILGVLDRDVREMVDECGEDRGLDLGRLIVRLHRQLHPEFVEAAGRVIWALMTPPPGRHRHPNHATAEEVVFESLRHFMETPAVAILDAAPLPPRIRTRWELAKGMAARYTEAQGDPGARDLIAGVGAAFYSGRSEDEVNRDEEIEAKDLLLPVDQGLLLIGVDGTVKPSREEQAEPSAGESPQEALQRVVQGTAALTTAQLVANPRTGLVEVRLGGGVAVPLMHTVAPTRVDDTWAAQRDYHATAVAGGISTTYRELKALDEKEETARGAALTPHGTTALEVSGRLTALKGVDATRMVLGATAGEDAEQRLVKEIRTRISIAHGLNMLQLALQQALQDDTILLDSIEALNRFLPNVTTLEVALVSLLEKAPRSVLDKAGLAMVFRVHYQGIEWANDTYDPELQRFGIETADPYAWMGMTGASSETEHVYFQKRIRELIEGALKSRLTDRYFFDFLWQRFSTSAMRGLAMLKDGSDPQFLINKEVIDLHHDQRLKPSQVVRLVGLLERVPACLNTPAPARIYFQTFGGGILFVDFEGRPLEHVPYHPHLQTAAMQQVHEATEATASDDNPLANDFMHHKLIVAIYEAALEQSEGESSLIEQLSLEFLRAFGIHLPLPLANTGADADWGFAVHSLKMGADEIAAMAEAFALVPPHVLARVRDGWEGRGGLRVVHKEAAPAADFAELTSENDRRGEYRAWNKSIVIYHLQAMSYRNLDGLGRQIWNDTVLHELAEALYEALPQEQRLLFVSIYPWGREPEGAGKWEVIPAATVVDMEPGDFEGQGIRPAFEEKSLGRHVLTSYSTANPRDLFCELFMAYIAHGPEFRERVEGSPHLLAAYNWLRDNVFTTPDSEVIEYVKPADVDLAQIEGQIKIWRAQGQLRSLELEQEERSEWAKEADLPAYVDSIEAARERAMDAEEARHMAEVYGEAYAEDYFTMRRWAEEGRRGALRVWRRRALGKGVASWEHGVLDAMHNALAVMLEVDYDSMEEREKKKAQKLVRQIVTGVWQALRNGQSQGATEIIEEKLASAQDEGGFEIAFHGEENDLLDELIEAACGEIAHGSLLGIAVVRRLSETLLPGQFTPKDIEALHGMATDAEANNIDAIHRIYLFIRERKAWRLNPAQAAELTGRVTWALMIPLGRRLDALQLGRLIQAVAGKKPVIEIAQELNMLPGLVDAFAEQFNKRQG